MFDPKKLAEYLDVLVPNFGADLAKSSLPIAEKMDKFDLNKQGDYHNLGTTEFPIYGKNPMASYADLGSSVYYYATPQTYPWPQVFNGFVGEAPPVEDKHVKIKEKISKLSGAEAGMVQKPMPDYTHTLTAWRGWQIDSAKLSALGTDHEWEPKKAQQAICKNHEHPAPQKSCSCGFWSFKTLDLLTEALKSYSDHVTVIGTVEIWGRVIECENGFRSEFAYPKELWLFEENMEYLSWTYGVPIRRIE
jgi:hypothetical protein